MSALPQPAAPRAAAGLRSVFEATDPPLLHRWAGRKLALMPRGASDLVVEVRDPGRLSEAEHAALLSRLRSANMALYVSRASGENPWMLRRLAARLGLGVPLAGRHTDDVGVARREIASPARRVRWHTDGYARPGTLAPVRSFVLHCVAAGEAGGELCLADPELAFLALWQQDDALVRALRAPDALSVAAQASPGGPRVVATGPVFALDAAGDLHTRFTTRRRHVRWAPDAVTAQAAARLLALLEGDAPYAMRVQLAPGMGLVCNNVLHARGFLDEPAGPRVMLEARFAERVPGTVGAWAALCR